MLLAAGLWPVEHHPLAVKRVWEERGILVAGRKDDPQALDRLEVFRGGEGDCRAIARVGRIGDDPKTLPDLRHARILTAPLLVGEIG